MRDVVLIAAVALAFAWVTTAHVAILAGLLRRKLYWRAAASLLLPVLAPYWASREHLRVRTALWLTGALVYTAAVALAWSSEPAVDPAEPPAPIPAASP